jgi:hypothetical protein
VASNWWWKEFVGTWEGKCERISICFGARNTLNFYVQTYKIQKQDFVEK